jgi:hypothetical protein
MLGATAITRDEPGSMAPAARASRLTNSGAGEYPPRPIRPQYRGPGSFTVAFAPGTEPPRPAWGPWRPRCIPEGIVVVRWRVSDVLAGFARSRASRLALGDGPVRIGSVDSGAVSARARSLSPMAAINAWRDFYIMGGGALATLTGLLFVAVSIHLGEILAVRPLLRNIEVALYGFLFQLVFCGFMLMPGVTLAEAGILIIVAGVGFAAISLRFASYRSPLDVWTNVSFGLLATPIGVLLIAGWTPALYLYAVIFGLSVASLVRLCWRLLTMAIKGLEETREVAATPGSGRRHLLPR